MNIELIKFQLKIKMPEEQDIKGRITRD